MAKYGIYANLGASATEGPKATDTALIFVGSAPSPVDYNAVHYIDSWEQFLSAFGGVNAAYSLTDAAVACLDMYGIPFHAIAVGVVGGDCVPRAFNATFYETLSAFINDSDYSSYLICWVGVELSPDLSSAIRGLQGVLTKPVYHVADIVGEVRGGFEEQSFIYIKPNGRPNIEKIRQAVVRFKITCGTDCVGLTFGDVLWGGQFRVAGSAVRAALMATLPVYENAGNKRVECGGIYGRGIYEEGVYIYTPLIITNDDADSLATYGVSTIYSRYGTYRTWGDIAVRGTAINYKFENVIRAEQYLSIDLAAQFPTDSMTLCDRDEIIRKENAYLDSLAALGAIKSGYLEWVENGDTGKWKFNIEPAIPTPIKALTAKVGRSEFI